MKSNESLVAVAAVLAITLLAAPAVIPWAHGLEQDEGQEQTGQPGTRESGRQFTQWFYNEELDRLWELFADEMKSAMNDDPDQLAGVRDQVRPLGAEVEVVDEQVAEADGYMVYLRTVRFANQDGRFVIQWAIDDEGKIGGFYIRPAQQ